MPTRADDASGRAQALFERGVRLSQDERWLEARDAFVRSAELIPRASTYYNLAVASLELGLARAALDALAQFDRHADKNTQADYVRQAAALRGRAQARIGTLVLSLAPEDARVEVDGQLEAGSGERVVLLDPGMHAIKASAPGHDATAFEVQIETQSTLHRRVELPAADAAKAAPARAIDLHVRPNPGPSPAVADDSADAAHAAESHHGRSFWAQPLTWIVLGAVVVAGVVTGVVIATHHGSNSPDPYTGRTL
jgi:tetratricopeptide (TPR) repeat protein